jgi:hypothetical protein
MARSREAVGMRARRGHPAAPGIAQIRALEYQAVACSLWTAMKEGLLGDTLQVSIEERAQGSPTLCCTLDWI